jgi:hypothetical protein
VSIRPGLLLSSNVAARVCAFDLAAREDSDVGALAFGLCARRDNVLRVGSQASGWSVISFTCHPTPDSVHALCVGRLQGDALVERHALDRASLLLRQYAALNALLRKCFTAPPDQPKDNSGPAESASPMSAVLRGQPGAGLTCQVSSGSGFALSLTLGEGEQFAVKLICPPGRAAPPEGLEHSCVQILRDSDSLGLVVHFCASVLRLGSSSSSAKSKPGAENPGAGTRKRAHAD